MIFKRFLFLTVLSLPAMLISCGGAEKVQKADRFLTISDVQDSIWTLLSGKKIYFAHQSVGRDIVNGIQDLVEEYPQIELNIVNTTDTSNFNKPIFAHSRVGENRQPFTKIKSFTESIESGIGGKADVAFFKFCYVDFPPKKDFVNVFQEYKETFKMLKQKYPETTFIHLTVPLVAQKDGFIKALIKRMLNRSTNTYADNINRTAFNRLLLKEYEGKEPLFDLARIESTLPDGTRSFVESKEGDLYALNVEYTYDGGHLNSYGRKIVAEQFLVFLAELFNSTSKKSIS